jgi:hypothetical protein
MGGQSTIDNRRSAMPTWVKRAAEANGSEPGILLERINELLYDGYQPSAVMSELGIPEQQERSLEVYARKYSHRRILAPVARLREALAEGVAALSPKTLDLLRLVVEQGLSPECSESKRSRSAEVIGKFCELMLGEAGKAEASDEATKGRADEGKVVERLSDEAMAQIRGIYGLPAGGGGGK